MIKKDGFFLVVLVDININKVIGNVLLKFVKLILELNKVLVDYLL